MQELKKEFILNFIEDNRWKYIVDGLKKIGRAHV